MTLSVQNQPPPWDRLLPKPMTLHPQPAVETYPRRSASLIQHHFDRSSASEHRATSENHSEAGIDAGEHHTRRSTVAYIPVTRPPRPGVILPHISSDATNERAAPSSKEPGRLILSTREHGEPVMSVEDRSGSASPLSSTPTEESGQFCLCQPEAKIPRPRNAFILYRQHHHTGVVAQHPGLPNPDISKIIGEQWQQLSIEAKEEWKALAEEEKARHQQQYPHYRYRPRRNGRNSGQSSTSGPSTDAAETHSVCQKCGGKVMSAPPTPYTPYTPGATAMQPVVGPPSGPQQNFIIATTQGPRMPQTQQAVSSPHSGRVRPYHEVFDQHQQHQRHDPLVQYAQGPPLNNHIDVSPEAKRRRFNSNGMLIPSRGVTYSQYYAPRDMTMAPPPRGGLLHAPTQQMQQVRPPLSLPPPPQLHQHQQQQQLQNIRHQQSHHQQQPPQHQVPQRQRDPSLVLPPLQTPANRTRTGSQVAATQTSESGLEAMIMSFPILNKLKILSQVSPELSSPGPASPPFQVRGAILAVEGMDSASVFSMTNSLADYLEKEGKFAVRIFGGPDPYALLDSNSRSGSNGEPKPLCYPDFLKVIDKWHSISKEMVEYITHEPDLEEQLTPTPTKSISDPSQSMQLHNIANVIMAATTGGSMSTHFAMTSPPQRRPITPPSAVSPKTILQTSELSIKSPPIPGTHNGGETPRAKSRIPAAALARQAQAQVSVHVQAETKENGHSQPTSQPERRASFTNSFAGHSRTQSQSQIPKSGNPTERATSTGLPPIPIAIVPHYQLTTVDASSIAMPITDNYSPHSHWQWLATLWRGCVGPDVTVVIKAPHEESDSTRSEEAAPRSNSGGMTCAVAASTTQAQAQAQAPGVELRLTDCRAVIVRTSMQEKERSESTVGTGRREAVAAIESHEKWEKAKRRVAFEVEEFLRR